MKTLVLRCLATVAQFLHGEIWAFDTHLIRSRARERNGEKAGCVGALSTDTLAGRCPALAWTPTGIDKKNSNDIVPQLGHLAYERRIRSATREL
jgi:hypothetical protein